AIGAGGGHDSRDAGFARSSSEAVRAVDIRVERGSGIPLGLGMFFSRQMKDIINAMKMRTQSGETITTQPESHQLASGRGSRRNIAGAGKRAVEDEDFISPTPEKFLCEVTSDKTGSPGDHAAAGLYHS